MTEPLSEEPVIRDKRRIDPTTGAVRSPQQGDAAAPASGPAPEPVPQVPAVAPEVADLEHRLEERTADLQRVTAEYANYRRRVDRDREAVADQALAAVLVGLLPVLDDIDRARSHGELEGGFKAVADNLETLVNKLGLERYGEAGEPFDPTVHVALLHALSPDVTEPTAVTVLQPGYRIGARILRPARVAVAEPEGTSDVDT